MFQIKRKSIRGLPCGLRPEPGQVQGCPSLKGVQGGIRIAEGKMEKVAVEGQAHSLYEAIVFGANTKRIGLTRQRGIFFD